MAEERTDKIEEQIRRAGLPTSGKIPFVPDLEKNQRGEDIIKKAAVAHGPKRGKKGFVDTRGRIWVKDRAHADVPDHWDVQVDGGQEDFRVGPNGEEIP